MSSSSAPTPSRHVEIDLLRTVAIVCMVIYHTAFDLSQFYGWNIDVLHGGWWLFARITAILFLILVGMTAAIGGTKTWKRHVKRFTYIGAAALLVTLVTYIIDPDTYVRFGILHLIAISALLLPVFTRLKEKTVIVGIMFILLGPYLLKLRMDTSLFLPLGLQPHGFATIDYFPIFPWFGVILIGYAIGYWMYVRHQRNNFSFSIFNFQFVTWIGRHSLLIYLVHQPIILGCLWLILGKSV